MPAILQHNTLYHYQKDLDGEKSMKFLMNRFGHYSPKWLKLAEILLSVAVKLSLCALEGVNVKKQVSLAQLFVIAVENVHKIC